MNGSSTKPDGAQEGWEMPQNARLAPSATHVPPDPVSCERIGNSCQIRGIGPTADLSGQFYPIGAGVEAFDEERSRTWGTVDGEPFDLHPGTDEDQASLDAVGEHMFGTGGVSDTKVALAPVDWRKPIEAFHDDGRVVPAEYLCSSSGNVRDVRFAGRMDYALPNGYVGGGWRIRNVMLDENPCPFDRLSAVEAAERVQRRVGEWDKIGEFASGSTFAAVGEQLRHDAMALVVEVLSASHADTQTAALRAERDALREALNAMPVDADYANAEAFRDAVNAWWDQTDAALTGEREV